MKTSTKHTLRLVLLSITILIGVGVGVLLYLFHKQIQTPPTKALAAIPSHTALFIESTKPAAFFNFTTEAQPLFSLFINEIQQKNIQQIVSILRDKKQGFDVEKQSNALYLSVHTTTRNEISLLFCVEADPSHDKNLECFTKQMASKFRNESFFYKGNEMIKLHLNDKDILYVNYQNGLLLLSFDESLLRASMNQLLSKDSTLYNMVNSFASKSDVSSSLRVYLQHNQSNTIFKKILEAIDGDAHITKPLKPFLWSALNVRQKNGEFIFSGYALADTSVASAKLLMQKKQEIDIDKRLPYNTIRLFYLNAKDFQQFSAVKPYVQTSEDVFGLMYPRQIAVFEMNTNDTVSNALLLVSENVSEAAFHLFHSVGSEFTENQYILDTFHVNTAMVGKINLNNFMITRFGYNQHFPKLCYYTVWDDNIVFTDTKAGMISYIQQLRAGKTLKTNKEYKNLQSYFSNQANVLYYNESPQKPIQRIRFQYDWFSDNLFLFEAAVRGREKGE